MPTSPDERQNIFSGQVFTMKRVRLRDPKTGDIVVAMDTLR